MRTKRAAVGVGDGDAVAVAVGVIDDSCASAQIEKPNSANEMLFVMSSENPARDDVELVETFPVLYREEPEMESLVFRGFADCVAVPFGRIIHKTHANSHRGKDCRSFRNREENPVRPGRARVK